MNVTKKTTLAIATVLTLGLASAAALSHGGGDGRMMDPQRMEQRMERMQERMDRHLEEMQAVLKLTPEQEPAWETFTQAMKERMEQRMERRADKQTAKQTVAPAGFLGHLDNRVQSMEQRLEDMKAMRQAAGALYDSLSAEQQAALDGYSAGHHGRMMGRHGGGKGHH